jgi:endonuclease G
MRNFFTRIFLLTLIAAAVTLHSPVNAEYMHLKMGNPSKATSSASNKNNYLMQKPYFALSYNNAKGEPNWVSWRLVASDIGYAPRVTFYPDQDLPLGFNTVYPRDYTGSGFDRGHMCPHEDRSANDDMSHATFVMTNIIPQSPNVNRKAWEQLEIYCRDLAKQGKTLYIISGPAGTCGTGSKGSLSSMGMVGHVVVPAKCWKVIMVLDGGSGDDIRRVNANTRLIAVIMPNDMSVGEDWAGFRVPVADVEKLTGFTFFGKVPTAIIGPLKKKADRTWIPAPRIRYRRNSGD